jgi:hypothetical protein
MHRVYSVKRKWYLLVHDGNREDFLQVKNHGMVTAGIVEICLTNHIVEDNFLSNQNAGTASSQHFYTISISQS